jgi:hypothetical protein
LKAVRTRQSFTNGIIRKGGTKIRKDAVEDREKTRTDKVNEGMEE